MKPVLLIDNLDSFTFNLVESLERIGVEVHVRRNGIAAADALAEAEAKGAILMISPGPGTPQGSGCCLELIALARGRVPLLGICLGMQMACIEGARAAGHAEASSTEFGETSEPVVGMITEWMSEEGLQERAAGGDLGGTMRLGA